MYESLIERKDIIDKFWKNALKVESDECWPWTGSLNNKGYGKLSWGRGLSVVASRFSYELHKGPISEGLIIMHTCDYPRCVNPCHLVMGTNADNTRDRQSKGRHSGRRRNTERRITDV